MVTAGGAHVQLAPREFDLLAFLMRRVGQCVRRDDILDRIWGIDFETGTNVVDVHISRLRAKIDRDFDTPLLHTVRGAGYRLAAE